MGIREPADDSSTGRYIVYRKAGIVINASYRLGPSDSVTILADTKCIDHPARGARRSPLWNDCR